MAAHQPKSLRNWIQKRLNFTSPEPQMPIWCTLDGLKKSSVRKLVFLLILVMISTLTALCQIENIDVNDRSVLRDLLKEGINDRIDEPLPPFEFFTHSGEWINSDSLDYEHTLIFIWNWSCQPCLDLFGSLTTLHEEFGSRVNFIAITSGDIEVIDDYLDFRSLPFPVVTNAKSYVTELGIKTIPKLLFADESMNLTRILNFRSFLKEGLEYHELRSHS